MTSIPFQFLENGADFTELVNNDYVLEFYIKHNNPNVRIEIKFASIPQENYGGDTICYLYDGNNYRPNGSWTIVVILLDALVSRQNLAKNKRKSASERFRSRFRCGR